MQKWKNMENSRDVMINTTWNPGGGGSKWYPQHGSKIKSKLPHFTYLEFLIVIFNKEVTIIFSGKANSREIFQLCYHFRHEK